MTKFLLVKSCGLVTGLFFVSACQEVGRDYVRPPLSQPAEFAFSVPEELRLAAQEKWWEGYDDPTLNALIEKALSQNLDLDIAEARIREARALLGTVGIDSRFSGDLIATASISKTNGSRIREASTAEIQPSFVLDLFGGAQRQQEVVLAGVTAAEFNRNSSQLGVVLELTKAYIDLRQREAEIIIRRQAVNAQRDIIKAISFRIEKGDALVVDLARAKAELAAAEANLPVLEADTNVFALRIATILSVPLRQISPELAFRAGSQLKPNRKVKVGVPAQLLRNRPDIRQAEANFAAAVAEIGVSEAQLYPSLSIDGTIRASSNSVISVGTALSVPLLNRKVLKARTAAARERAKQSELAWKKSVLFASEEVEVALLRYHSARTQVKLHSRSVRAQRDAIKLSREAFALGEVLLSDLLMSEQSLADARVKLTIARSAQAASWAQLNTAVGNGWSALDTSF